jgi:hypothetical protein
MEISMRKLAYLAFLTLFVLACSVLTPSVIPTISQSQIQIAIALTQTAAIPAQQSVTNPPAATSTPSPIITQPSSAPMLSEPVSPNVDPSTIDDTAYKAYLSEHFDKIGDHTMTLDSIDIRHDRISGRNSTDVNFNIGYNEANYMIQEDTSAARKSWATSLLSELKTHWPNQDISGALLWSYTSTSLEPDTDCSTTGDTLFSDGWIHIVYFARILYGSDFGDDISCYG